MKFSEVIIDAEERGMAIHPNGAFQQLTLKFNDHLKSEGESKISPFYSNFSNRENRAIKFDLDFLGQRLKINVFDAEIF